MSRFLLVFGLAAASSLLAACGGAESKAPTETTAKESSAAPDSAVSETDMVIGAADAPVTIIEYASVTCPHCATFHETIFPEIKEKYIDTGKVKFVFREFPTPPVNYSVIGSVLARCAAEKGGDDAYFIVLGSLFKNQRSWITDQDPKTELLKIVSQAGMNEEAFDACLKRQDFIDLISANTKEGSDKFGINSTPSFVMGGEKIEARTAEDFSKLIDEALADGGA